MFLNLPRHERNTLLRAIQTAKNLLTKSVSPKVCIDNLKNTTSSVYYYIFILNHIYNVAHSSQNCKLKIQLSFCTILL